MTGLSLSGSSPTLAVHGVDFKLNGAPITGLNKEGDILALNIPTGARLTGVLEDGTPLVLNA